MKFSVGDKVAIKVQGGMPGRVLHIRHYDNDIDVYTVRWLESTATIECFADELEAADA